MDAKRLGTSLAVAALAAGLIVVLADAAGRPTAAPPRADWSAQLEEAGDHITPRALADRMLAKHDDTVVVDVRPADEFVGWHLPGAVNLSVPQLLGAEGDALFKDAGDKLVVLTSNGMVHPAQAWVELTRRGHSNVRVLEGGLTDFKRVVLTPPSLRGPMSEAKAKLELPRFEAARTFFLGARHAGPTTTAAVP